MKYDRSKAWQQRSDRQRLEQQRDRARQVASLPLFEMGRMAAEMAASIDRDLTSAIFGGTCTSTIANPTTITAERIYADMARVMREIGPLPDPVRIDLYGHDLERDMVYEIKDTSSFDCMPDFKGRRFVICHRDRLEEFARMLAMAGAEVRIEPRIRDREQAAEDEQS